MAQTLTNERNLLERQEAIERDLRIMNSIRIIEWGVAVLCLVIGIFWKLALGIGAALAFLALGHEARRREQMKDQSETASIREAKGAVARLLDEKLANDHYVLNDLHLIVGREKCWIDHLVVAPSGMFVITTMNWDGKIVGDTGKQVYQWKILSEGKVRPVRNPVGKAMRDRRILCNWLKGTSLIWERVFPLVVLANPNAEIQITNAERRVLTPEQAVTFINDFCFQQPVLSNAEVEKLANGLNRHVTET